MITKNASNVLRKMAMDADEVHVGSFADNLGPEAHHMSYFQQLKRNAGNNFVQSHPNAVTYIAARNKDMGSRLSWGDLATLRSSQAMNAADKIAPRYTKQWEDAYKWYEKEGNNNHGAYVKTGKPVPVKREPIPSSIPKEQHQQMIDTAAGIAYNSGGRGGSNTAIG